MEKLDINEFLKKKEEISNFIENAEENMSQNNLSEEELINIYVNMINEITEYDLSEIPFEAWENLYLGVSKNHSLDFSKTKANIDFNLIEYEIEDNKNINFRNCNLKNYDFYYKAYSPDMFDEKFIKEHQDKFLDDSAPENIKNIVYNRKFITIKEIKENIELIKYIDYLQLENKKIYKEIYNKIGENEFLKLDEDIFKYSEELKRKEIKTILSSDFSTAKEIEDKLYNFISLEIRPNQYNEEMKKRYPDYFFDIKEDDENKYVKEQFNDGRLSIDEIIGNWDILKSKNLDYVLIKSNYNMYINKHKLDTKALNKIMNTELIKIFIKNNIKFDINEIINDDHKFNNNINSYINQLIKKDDIDSLNEEIFKVSEYINNLNMSDTTKKESLKEFIKNILYIYKNNEEIEKNIIERLKSSIDDEFWISDKAPYDLKEKFYKREISVKYIKSNLAEYNQYLKNKDLGYFTNCPIIYNIQDKLGKENGFAYWIENGTYIERAYKQNVKSLKYIDDMAKKDFLREIDKYILNGIKAGAKYDDKMSEKFKEKYRELFLVDNAPEELKKVFYNREIDFEYISLHPEYNEYLRNMDLEILLKHIPVQIEGEEITLAKIIKEKLGNEEGFKFLLKNGKYIERSLKIKANTNNLTNYKNISKEDFLKEIDEFILNGIKAGIKYDDKLPEQFKEKYREIFLEDNAPEELKKLFYNREIDFEYISLHPEYNEYLKNKDLENLVKYMPIQIEDEEISLAQIIKEKIGNEEGFKFLLKNGKYIERAFKNNADTNNLVNYKNMTKEDFLKEIDEYIMDGIKKGAKYDDKMPEQFKEKHKEIFLESSVSKEIQEKFYNKKLTLEDIKNNKEIQDALESKKIFFGFPKEILWVNELFRSNDDLQQTNLQRLKIIKEFEKIEDTELRNVFGEFCKTSMKAEINELILENIESISEVLKRLSLTNSTEMFKFRTELANQILKTNDPIRNFEKMENIFIGNETPTFVKLYQCNDIVNHNLSERFSFDRKGIMSPVLIRSNDIFKRLIIFSDLAKIELYSNNKSVKEFLNKVEIENKLYTDIKNGNIKYDDLNEENKKLLKSFSRILCVTYNNSISIKDANNEEYNLTENTLKDIEELSTLVCGNNKDVNLGDEIIRKTFALNNIKTIDEARKAMKERIAKVDQRNRKVGNENTNITLNKGDYVKGIGSIEFLGKILQGGSVSREFLGENSGSDSTPLDTDLSKITTDIGTNLEKINKTVSKGYGPIYFILKNDDKFVTTIEDKDDLWKRQDSSNEEYQKEYLSKITRDMSKNEIFCTGAIRK